MLEKCSLYVQVTDSVTSCVSDVTDNSLSCSASGLFNLLMPTNREPLSPGLRSIARKNSFCSDTDGFLDLRAGRKWDLALLNLLSVNATIYIHDFVCVSVLQFYIIFFHVAIIGQ